MIRRPAVAGQFYPGSKELLRKTVDSYLDSDREPRDVLGLAAPHAGYVYSGATAGRTYASAIIPEKCVIISPNHTGAGARAAVMTEGEWMTPLGNVPIDTALAADLLKRCPLLAGDSTAHVAEHSLEVQLPFLQERQPSLSIVPITIQHANFNSCETIGRAIASAIKESGKKILIVASTDMNHYENEEITKKKDNLAIEKVVGLDPEGLINTCGEYGITMCGVIPTAIMLVACIKLGATKGELIEHSTSGDVSGDFGAVVGYAGFLVY